MELDRDEDPEIAEGKVFGVVGLGIFTFAFLANVNATPQLATFGLGAILILALAIALFLIPTAVSSAELGTTWPRTGGIYVWTKMAFGEAAGFAVIWLEWANFVVAWPGLMGGLTVQTAFVIDPGLADSPLFIIAVVILVTWLATAAALRGLRVASAFAWYSVIAGTVLPALLLVGFAVAYLWQGNSAAMEISASALVPELSFATLAFISGALLMFSGIEISAIHSDNVQRPQRTIPRANLIAVILCLAFFVPLTLALATMVPASDINIVTGILQSARNVFDEFELGWLTAVMAFLLVSGTIAALVQIISGPSRGLLIAARQGGNLPPTLQSETKLGMPVAIILLQAVISSALALGYSFLGSVQNAWFMFLLIQTNMTLIIYLMMFASVIKLRRIRPHRNRPFRIPGKRLGLWAVTGVGGLVCLLGLLISFIPTEEAGSMPLWLYLTVLIGGTVVFVAAPFVFWLFRKPSWAVDAAKETTLSADG